ncbi:MAG: sensor histidine kinase [Deltaproteobacteria bacterium]|nr:sensor histidine kinase [Deltaproteobacteria bacterium]
MFQYLEDPERSMTVEQAASSQRSAEYQPLPAKGISFGFSNSAYWFRVRVTNHTLEPDWILDVGFPALETADLYVQDSQGRWSTQHTGIEVPADRRPIQGRSLDFPLSIPPGQTVTLYLRLANPGGTMAAPVRLGDHNWVENEKRNVNLVLGSYYGATYGLALYNLFLFFLLRSRAYLVYVALNLCTSFIQLLLDGILQAHLIQGLTQSNHLALTIALSCAQTALIIHLGREFLELPRTFPRWNGLLRRLQQLLIATGAAGMVLGIFDLPGMLWPMQFMMAQVVVTVMAMVGLAVNLSWRGEALARYFFAAQMFTIAGGMVVFFIPMGMAPANLITMHGMQIGSVAEMVIFSMALAEQVNRFRSAKERAETLAEFREGENQELRRTKDALEEAIRLKNRFMTLMAHDIRTPVSTILTLAETLKLGEHPLAPEQIETLNRMRVRGEGFLKMAEELMRFNHLQSGAVTVQKTWVTGEEITAEPMGMNLLAESKTIHMANRVPPTARFYCDPILTREVLQNLVVNAIKFCRSGDTITLEIRGDHTLAVADTGPGISADLLPDLFREDKKTSTVGSAGEIGTGLGLPLAREMMRVQGGELRVASSPGRGAVFLVDLPHPA